MAKYCTACGNRCLDNAVVCDRCGKTLGAANVALNASSQWSNPSNVNQYRTDMSRSKRKKVSKNLVIAVGSLAVVLILLVIIGILINPSIKGRWRYVDEEGTVTIMVIDANTCTFMDETGDQSLVYHIEMTKDKLYLNEEEDYIWYRKRGRKLYLYDDASGYESKQEDAIYERE